MAEPTNSESAAGAEDQGPFANDGERVKTLMEDMFSTVAGPDGVFGRPVAAGDRVVITAREVSVGGGFGWGGGMTAGEVDAVGGDEEGAGEEEAVGTDVGHGAGGGGGGSGRPVAVIDVGPDGVNVTPVVDKTKLGLAAVGAWSAVALAMFTTVKTLFGKKK